MKRIKKCKYLIEFSCRISKQYLFLGVFLILGLILPSGVNADTGRVHLVKSNEYSSMADVNYLTNKINCSCANPYQFEATASFSEGHSLMLRSATSGFFFNTACPSIFTIDAVLTINRSTAIYKGSVVLVGDRYSGLLNRTSGDSSFPYIQLWNLKLDSTNQCS